MTADGSRSPMALPTTLDQDNVDIGSDRGDVLLNGLLNLVLGLLVVGLIVFEIGAVAVNAVQLDGIVQDAARAAATQMSQTTAASALEQAALSGMAGQRNVRLDALTATRETVTVTVSRPAPVLLVDRIPPLRDHLVASATSTARVAR